MRYMAAGASILMVCGSLTFTPTAVADTTVSADSTVMPYDYDGDGYSDMTVGVVGEDLKGTADVGTVQVLYGSDGGVSSRDQLWHQGVKGVKGALERGDRFGRALASRDFDGDGYADLAVGIPDEDIRKKTNAGAVQVLYGGAKGLTARDQIWHQGTAGVPGGNQIDDKFGFSLAAGDLNGDGYADLAIGLPYEDNGSVVLLFGASSGLTSARSVRLRQGKNGMPSTPGGYENFGRHLSMGDIDADGFDDLLIEVGSESDSTLTDYSVGSAVHVLRGSEAGVEPTGSQYILPADLGLSEMWQVRQMALCDFNADARDDLVLSSNENVAVLHGSAEGLRPTPLPVSTTPGTDAVWSVSPWFDDDVGPDAACGDLTGDGNADLAVESVRAVKVIQGTAAGLEATSTTWSDESWTWKDWTNLAVQPNSGGTHAWLVVNTINDVAVLRGTADGTAGPIETWSQNSPGVKGRKEAGDAFGLILGR